MTDHVEIRRRTYHDSVRLMQASATVGAVPGVGTALIAMATDLNLDLLAELSFSIPDDTTPDDLIIAVRADADGTIAAALAALEQALATPPSGGDGTLDPPPPRTGGSAADRIGAGLVLISVPGPHAYVEAVEALERGRHVMIFSDNVPVHQEIDLKHRAAGAGLLVMGPDCGTAIVGGVGLGFANAVEPGPVGIVGASGTGIQQLCCLLDGAGVGIRHALGTGSRDLSETVGGAATLQGLGALDRDPGTEAIVVVSKPPAAEVAARVADAAAACSTPTVTCFVGRDTISAAAAKTLTLLGGRLDEPACWEGTGSRRAGALRGLFSGGTLRDEAASVIAAEREEAGPAPELVDLGDDRYTRGRPHPMIDQRLLLDHIGAAIADPGIGVLLLDVVLGYGSHPDPAAALAPALSAAVDAGMGVVVSLCGTASDPQDREAQARALWDAGASVFLSNAAAARRAAGMAVP